MCAECEGRRRLDRALVLVAALHLGGLLALRGSSPVAPPPPPPVAFTLASAAGSGDRRAAGASALVAASRGVHAGHHHVARHARPAPAPPPLLPEVALPGALTTAADALAGRAVGPAAPKASGGTPASSGSGSGAASGNGPGSGDGNGTGARYMKTPPAHDPKTCTRDSEYPPLADRMNIEGVVRLRLELDERGHVTHAAIIRGLGYGLDEEALDEVLHKCVFTPARDQFGRPMPFTIDNFDAQFLLLRH